MSSNGSFFRGTGLCAGNSPATCEFPSRRASNTVFLWCRSAYSVKQTIEWRVIWDYMAFMWRNRNGIAILMNVLCNTFTYISEDRLTWGMTRWMYHVVQTNYGTTQNNWFIIVPVSVKTSWENFRQHGLTVMRHGYVITCLIKCGTEITCPFPNFRWSLEMNE